MNSLLFFVSLCICGAFSQDWLQDNLRRQRELAKDIPIDIVTEISTHNSYNAEASGYRYPNQKLSLTEQLNLGARRIGFDVHYVDDLEPPLRVCHGSIDGKEGCLKADKQYEDLFGTSVPPFEMCSTFFDPPIVDRGDSTGCYDDARTLLQSIREVEAWLRAPENQQEFIILSIDTDQDARELRGEEIKQAFQSSLGDLLFTPSMWNDSTRWPSHQEILDMDKQVLVSSSKYQDEQVFHIRDWPHYPHNKIMFFTEYPECGSSNTVIQQSQRSFSMFYGDESLTVSRSLIPILVYNGTSAVGRLGPEETKKVNACGYSAQFDFLDESKAKASVWTFAEQRPFVSTHVNCAAMGDNEHQGWVDLNCYQSFKHACQSNTNSTVWELSSMSGSWFEGDSMCPEGFSFSVPRTAYDNHHLKLVKQVAAEPFLWLQYSDIRQEGRWEVGMFQISTTTGMPGVDTNTLLIETDTEQDLNESTAGLAIPGFALIVYIFCMLL